MAFTQTGISDDGKITLSVDLMHISEPVRLLLMLTIVPHKAGHLFSINLDESKCFLQFQEKKIYEPKISI